MTRKDDLLAVIEILQDLQEDSSISKSLKKVIEDVLNILSKHDSDIRIQCSKALEEFEKISDDSSIDPYMRTQVWNIVSMLENISSS